MAAYRLRTQKLKEKTGNGSRNQHQVMGPAFILYHNEGVHRHFPKSFYFKLKQDNGDVHKKQ